MEDVPMRLIKNLKKSFIIIRNQREIKSKLEYFIPFYFICNDSAYVFARSETKCSDGAIFLKITIQAVFFNKFYGFAYLKKMKNSYSTGSLLSIVLIFLRIWLKIRRINYIFYVVKTLIK